MELGFDHRVRFLGIAFAQNRRVVPALVKMRLKTLRLTQGILFAGKWMPMVESPGKAPLLSMTQAQLARDQSVVAIRTASDPLKKREEVEKSGQERGKRSRPVLFFRRHWCLTEQG